MSDLETAFAAIQAKNEPYSTLWDYYDGNHPLVYSTQRLREVFQRIDARFEQNWCAVVIDSAIDRLELQGVAVANDETKTARLKALWMASGLDLDADDAHLAALVTGEAFVIAWKDADGQVEAFYNDPRLCHIEYESENPRKKLWAAKMWTDADKRMFATLYYPDKFEYYTTEKAVDQSVSAKSFVKVQSTQEQPNPAENATGEVPVFHLRREQRAVRSELANAITLQNGVNKLFADMMVAAEFGAFRQRYVISNAGPGTLKNAPNEIWDIPAADGQGQDTSVGEFSATDLGNYIKAMDKLAASIGIISRTPKHYFFSQGGDPSGEALIALEAPLNKKVGRYIRRFSATWKEVAAFLLKLDGQDTPVENIQAIYAKPETVQPKTQAEIIKANTDSGIPLRTVVRREGWTPAEIQEMDVDRIAEGTAQKTTLAQAMAEAQRRFNEGGG